MRRNPVESLWAVMERHPWITLALILALQTAFTLDARALWFSDEVRYANAYENLIKAGKWVVLYLNGLPYPDKPPVYFWLLAGLDKLTPFDPPELFFVAAALSGLFFVYASQVLAKYMGLDRKTRLASGLILLSAFFFIQLSHYSRMDLLFAAFIILSHGCFYHAFTSEKSSRAILGGFALAAAAVMTKGPLGLIFPLLTSAAFLGWRGELGKLRNQAMLGGLSVFLAVILAWILAALAVEGRDFVHNILYTQIFVRATNTFHHKEAFYYYILALPPAWLPWTLAVLADPKSIPGPARLAELWRKRKTGGDPAQVWLWAMLLSGFIFLSCLSGKVLVYILPLFAPLSMLTADKILTQSEKANHKTWAIIAGFLLLLAVAAPITKNFLPFEIKGLWYTTLILGPAGLLLFVLGGKGTKAPLLALVLAVTVWIPPLYNCTLASLDPLLSPQKTGLEMRGYAEKGYHPVAYRIYPGIFTYYAGKNVEEVTERAQLREIMARQDKVALVMRAINWDEPWDFKPQGFTKVMEQSVAGMTYYLLVRDERPGN